MAYGYERVNRYCALIDLLTLNYPPTFLTEPFRNLIRRLRSSYIRHSECRPHPPLKTATVPSAPTFQNPQKTINEQVTPPRLSCQQQSVLQAHVRVSLHTLLSIRECIVRSPWQSKSSYQCSVAPFPYTSPISTIPSSSDYLSLQGCTPVSAESRPVFLDRSAWYCILCIALYRTAAFCAR